MKSYEVTVTYKIYAQDENDALEQVFTNRVEPETVDVLDLPTRQKVEIDYVPF
jgi:hypothetical protein